MFTRRLARSTFSALLACASFTSVALEVNVKANAIISEKAADPSTTQNFGFANQLSPKTEFYLSSLNTQKYLAAFTTTRFYQTLQAELEAQKKPSSPPEPEALKAAKAFLGDDIFLTGGGVAQFLLWAREYSHLSNELNIRGALHKVSAPTGAKASNSDKALAFLKDVLSLNDSDLLRRIESLAESFEAPSLVLGVHCAHPELLAKTIFSDELLGELAQQNIRPQPIKTEDGTAFTLFSIRGEFLLSAAQKEAFVAGLPPEVDESAKAFVKRLANTVQSKTIQFGWAVRGDALLLFAGKDIANLKFATSPESSLAASKEFRAMEPLLKKELMGVAYMSQGLAAAAVDRQPLSGLIKSLVLALEENSEQGAVAPSLRTQLEEFQKLETALFNRETTAQTAVVYWDKVLHFESFGGVQIQLFQADKPLEFSSLLAQPGVLFGIDYQKNRSHETLSTEWAEKLVEVLYNVGTGLLKKIKPEGAQQIVIFEALVRPTLLQIYQAQKALYQKGLGSETALIVDGNGTLPALPNLPPQMLGAPTPRLTSVAPVTNRAEISVCWDKIQAATKTAMILLNGNNNRPGATAPASLEPTIETKDGVESYFFQMPFFAGDLQPSVVLSDKLFLLSTSKLAAESMAKQITREGSEKAEKSGKNVEGLVWTLDIAGIMELSGKLGQQASPAAASQKKDFSIEKLLRWSSVFQRIDGHVFEENSVLRQSATWELHDLPPEK